MSKLYDYYVDEYGAFLPYTESPVYERSRFRGRRRGQSGAWEDVIDDVEEITGDVLETFLDKARGAARSPIVQEAAVHTGVFVCKLALFLIIRSSQDRGIELCGHL